MSSRGRVAAVAGSALILLAVAVLFTIRAWRDDTTTSPYISQLTSSVRGLSEQEVDDLLNGRGAGYARMAELNQYPGPRHVLDMRNELGLTEEQVTEAEAIFASMQSEAQRLGQEIVHREALLSAAFAAEEISEAELSTETGELGKLYGNLRAVHLQAHLQLRPLLSAEQVTRYDALRGYGEVPDGEDEHQHQSD